jgi:transposase InsO family protein
MVAGYAIADRMTAQLVCDALAMACRRITIPEGAIFHSTAARNTSATATVKCLPGLGLRLQSDAPEFAGTTPRPKVSSPH